MSSKKAFSLMEILIALVLMGLVILAVVSVDITSRRFFGTSKTESWIQDEAKIAMEHIVRHVQRGIGDMTNSEVADGTSSPSLTNTRGFYILDANENLATSGNRIQVKLDTNINGRFDVGTDEIIEYNYDPAPYTLIYIDGSGISENLADGIVSEAIFSFDSDTPNQVDVELTVRQHPELEASLDNPDTTLTSSIILRAMSTD